MAGGGGAKNQTVTQTNLPEYAEPYFLDMMDRATDLSLGDYTPYGGQRLANQASDTTASYDMVRGLGPISGLDTAMNSTAYNTGAAQGIADDVYARTSQPYDPYQFSQYSGYQAQSVNPYQDFDAYSFGDSERWTDPGVAESYMSPYIANVMDTQKQRAELDYDRLAGKRAADAVQAGAFGGSREAVANMLAQEELTRQMAEIDAQGLQQAYETGIGAFQGDRDARLGFSQAQAQEMARVQGMSAEELARVQGISVEEARRIQNTGAQELARVQQSQSAEDMAAAEYELQAAQMGAGTALEALNVSGQQAGQLANLGNMERDADVEQAQLLEAAGQAQQAYEQAGMDIAFDDFLRQQGFAESQLQILNSIMRGVPVGPSQTTTTYSQNNPLADVLGAGLSTIGLSKGLS